MGLVLLSAVVREVVMCGIAGILAKEGDAKHHVGLVQRITDSLAHRGPDASGIHQDGPVVLGHRRLAILDLSAEAAQPMLNEDGSIALAINGEIYNFKDLRRLLESKGHHFRSRSDSEVVLHLYEEEGLDFLQRLRGMFALALWDGRNRRLLLARDRFGKKPLFYAFCKEGLVFASELQALLACKLIPREYDIYAIDAYLALQYVPAPMTAFRGARKLEPGHFLLCAPGLEPTPQRYYKLRFAPTYSGTLDDAARELRYRLEEAVRLRMVADVPLGAFLSGGIDSSAVVALMARFSERPVKTFAIGFPEPEESELPYASEVAKSIGTDHSEMIVRPDMVSVIPLLVKHYGEPFADTSAVPTWYLSKFTKSQVTVALSGDAGDENFSGYRRYWFAALGRLLEGLPRPLPRLVSFAMSKVPFAGLQPVRDFGLRLLAGEVQRYLGLVAHFPHEDRLSLYSRDMREIFRRDQVAERFQYFLDTATAEDAAGRLIELDFATYLPDDILVKVDIASMAHALEVRCPFLDHELVEFVASLPTRFKLGPGGAKLVLKRAVGDILPPRIIKRKKKGFSIPIDRWLREDLKPMAWDLLSSARFASRGIFDVKAVEQLLVRHAKGEPRGLQIWNLLILESWFRLFIDGDPAV